MDTATLTNDDLLIAYGKAEIVPSKDQLKQLVAEGYVFDSIRGLFTDAGFERLEELGVPVKEISIVTIATQLTIRLKDKTVPKGYRNLNIRPGSQLLVTYFQQDKYGQVKFYECYGGADVGIVHLYPNSGHVFETHKWPALWPLEAIGLTSLTE